MALNYIWVAFFFIAFIFALFRLIFLGDLEVFPKLVNATFDMSKTAFEISIYLTGVTALWLGLMKVGERGGIVAILTRFFGPIFARLFPGIPPNHPVLAPIIINFSATFLGIDNAGTPLGIRAMQELQELNPDKDQASNAQIMFVVLNNAGLTLIPISIIMYRVEAQAANPTDVFIPVLLATSAATIAGLIAVALYQRINLWNRVVGLYLGGFALFVAGVIALFASLPPDRIEPVSQVSSNLILFSIIVGFMLLALRKGVNVYETFIEGAKEGFSVAVRIIPYLVAILVAVGVFRESGALEMLVSGIRWVFEGVGLNTDFVPALPTAIMKPLSGSGARGLMIDTMKTYGPDSFAGRLACIIQGSSDTTFYILAVYFGAININRTRHALACCLICDLVGVVTAIAIGYLFFH